MTTYRSFEETEVWKKARLATKRIYEITREKDFFRDYALKDQIRRAAISVMSNISEGFERDGQKELVQFLSISKGSVGEIKSQLYIAYDAGYIDDKVFNEMVLIYDEISRMLGGFMKYLKSVRLKGKKYK